MNHTDNHLATPDRGSISAEMVIFVVPFMVMMIMFLVFCGRSASASIDVNAAAAAGARAAAGAPTPATAITAAHTAITATTTWTCSTDVDTSAHRRGGHVTVTVTCYIPLSDLGLPIGSTRTVVGKAIQPIDTYRAEP